MPWETRKGRRYFYEVTYRNGKRIRKCWGSGPEAEQAAQRVEQAKLTAKQNLDRLHKFQVQNQRIDSQIAAFSAQISAILAQDLIRSGLHFSHGQWRKHRTK